VLLLLLLLLPVMLLQLLLQLVSGPRVESTRVARFHRSTLGEAL
jgi:hypothetical protein